VKVRNYRPLIASALMVAVAVVLAVNGRWLAVAFWVLIALQFGLLARRPPLRRDGKASGLDRWRRP
jgi:uncharacterized protein (DUF58 family)